MDIKIKVIETKKIPIDKIKLGNIQVHQTHETENLELLAEHIRKIGLIQPIVVYPDGDNFELIVGRRRFLAYKDVLKWSEILAMIIEKPDNDVVFSVMSWVDSTARLQMTNEDKRKFVANMYS